MITIRQVQRSGLIIFGSMAIFLAVLSLVWRKTYVLGESAVWLLLFCADLLSIRLLRNSPVIDTPLMSDRTRIVLVVLLFIVGAIFALHMFA